MRVLLFAQLREAAGRGVLEFSVHRPLDQAQLWAELERICPPLAAHRPITRLARNGEYARPDAHYTDTDEVALIPPVSGG
jgi:molybdopterin converting factor small subunit